METSTAKKVCRARRTLDVQTLEGKTHEVLVLSGQEVGAKGELSVNNRKRDRCKKLPNPGSDEALDMGCTCPVLDNAHGRGAWGSGGDDDDSPAVFWMSMDCPIHAKDVPES